MWTKNMQNRTQRTSPPSLSLMKRKIPIIILISIIILVYILYRNNYIPHKKDTNDYVNYPLTLDNG